MKDGTFTADRLLALYDRVAEAEDAIPRLRRFVLDLAVRGKLVQQDPSDEPAAELLKRIAKEKARLVKARGLRASKAAEHAMGEAPFDLPFNWAWAAIGTVFIYDAGDKRDPKELDQSLWLLELEDVEKDTGRLIERITADQRESQSTKSQFRAGDILYGKLRPYLNKVLVADGPGYSTTEIVALRPYLPLCSSYCALALRRPDFVEYVTRLGQGTKMPRLRTEDAVVAPFPLPPLAEQQRIVAKVDELMALCDRLQAARAGRAAVRDLLTAATWARLTAPETDAETFPTHARFALQTLPTLTTRSNQIKTLRQTILNLAVRGKLVEQDPTDEPAAELLKRIAKEVAVKRKGMGLRPQDTLPSVDENDTPFELPVGWAWARFPEVGVFARGKSKHRPRNDLALYVNGTIPFVQTGDVARSGGLIKTHSSVYNETGLQQSMLWPAGTMCITIAANIADSGILTFDACFPDSVVGLVAASCFENGRFFEYFVRTAKANLTEFAPATAQKNINLGILEMVLIPLPPLAEQHRIVAKVDALMALCDQLESSLTTGTTTRSRLLEALLHKALEPAADELEAAE